MGLGQRLDQCFEQRWNRRSLVRGLRYRSVGHLSLTMAVFTGLPLVFSAEGQAAFWGDPVLGLGSAVGHESQPDLHKPALKPTGSGVLATHGALLSQAELSPSTQALPVTVVLQNTDQGLELVLTSVDGNAESVPLSAQAEVEGNRQRYVLNSVRLVQEERWVDPVEGIAAIVATNQPGDRLLIEITGSQAAAPEIKVVTTETGITFRFVAPAVPATGTNPATEASPATETQPSTEGISLVVTAQKREEEAQTVPIALTVFDEEAITDQQISSFSDLTARTPNFNFPQNVSGRIFGFYSLRGLNNGNFLNRRDVLGVYVDDVPLEYGAFLTGDFFDIERIEFLRGPQSTLYGRNSQAGAINIISRPPSNEPEARINSSYGNFDSKSFGLSFSDALIPDQLKFRLAANYRGTDGFTRNRFLDTNAGEQQDVQVRGELLWTPSNRWELSARAGGSWLNDGDSVYAAIDADDPYEVEYNRDGKLENQSTTQALKIVHRADTFEATSISTHRFSEQNGRETEGDYSPLDLFVADYSFGAEVWSQEIRFQSPDSADRLRWLLGGYFEANQSTVDGEGFTIVGQGVDEIFSETQQRTWAGFGQVDFKPVEPLTLSAGLRYEYNSGRFDRDRFFTPEGSAIASQGGQVSAMKPPLTPSCYPNLASAMPSVPSSAPMAALAGDTKPVDLTTAPMTLASWCLNRRSPGVMK